MCKSATFSEDILKTIRKITLPVYMGALQRGPTQNFGWVGHNAFGPINNWPVCSLVKLV